MENFDKILDSNINNDDLSVNSEIIDRNIQIKKQLLKERRARITIMSLLLSALLFTVIYGTLENPFEYTFSKIGNRFDNRVLFIVWALFTGFTIQFSVIQLFRLEKYSLSKAYKYIFISTGFLISSSIAPALEEIYPFWTWFHIITAGLFGLFITLSVTPFMRYVSKENPRLREVIKYWIIIIWGGSVFWMVLLGNTGIFELWGLGSLLVFLLYLSLTLFEEQIVKQSVKLLKGEQDLNLGIENIFVNWDKLKKKKNRKNNINKKS